MVSYQINEEKYANKLHKSPHGTAVAMLDAENPGNDFVAPLVSRLLLFNNIDLCPKLICASGN